MALTDNLVAYYKFDSGALTTDSVGSNTLTNVNTVAGTSSGKIGYGADFGSSNTTKYFERATSLVNNDVTNAAYSLVIWIKPTAFVNNDRTFFFGTCTNTKIRRAFGVFWNGGTSTKLACYTYNGSAGDGLLSTEQYSNITLNTYMMFGYTVNQKTVTFYLNGVNVGSATGTSGNGASEASSFRIGRGSDNTNYTMGLGDEAAVWDGKILTDAEMTALYNSGNGLQYPFTVGNPGAFFQLF